MLLLLNIFIILCIVVFLEWMREIRTFRITHYHIRSKKLQGLKRTRKVILLSDLHNCCYGKANEKLLTAIEKEAPDMILVAGDMVVGKPSESFQVAEDFMTALPNFCQVYCANGNHEQRIKEVVTEYGESYKRYKDKLLQAGVRYLENEREEVLWDGVPIEVVGLEIPREKYAKFRDVKYELQEMEEQIGKRNASYEILIAHNPTYVETYLAWGADLVVSGHFHGGVVRLPFIGGIISPQFHLFPKYSGEMTKVGDAAVVVSKGLGTHTIKVRLFNPAEIVVLHVDGTEE